MSKNTAYVAQTGEHITEHLMQRWERRLLADGLAPKTLENYLGWARRVTKRFPQMSGEHFAEMVEICSASLRRQLYSSTTIHQFQCTMARFARDILGWEFIETQELIRARPAKPIKGVPSVEEVRAFVDSLQGYARLIALLNYCCGLRISEACQLQLGDVSLVSRTVTVRESKCSRGRKVPVPPELIEMLQGQAAMALEMCEQDLQQGNVYAPLTRMEYRRRPSQGREPGQWPLFPQMSLVPNHELVGYVRVFVHKSNIEKAFKAARARSGVVTRITPHVLRHAYAVHSLVAGAPIVLIQQYLGHASIETTAKYLTHLMTPEGVQEFPTVNLFVGMLPKETERAAAV